MYKLRTAFPIALLASITSSFLVDLPATFFKHSMLASRVQMNAEITSREEEFAQTQRGHFLGYGDPLHEPSILQKIVEKRYDDLRLAEEQKSSETLRAEIEKFDELYGYPINLFESIASTDPEMAIAAEFKRASPSKGDIAPDLDAVEQGLLYASAGATVISVLTEPFWFKGTLKDMRRIRIATQSSAGPLRKRPAILRKDFIIDEYMILEARAHGADTVLLIVAILEVDQLRRLIAFSRAQGLEPLVEVHTDQEMEIALDSGARVIGVNSRNLHTFKLDMGTTERVSRIAALRSMSWGHRGDIQLAALSGITGPNEVEKFRALGVSMVLVGEALMRAPDPVKAISSLLERKDRKDMKLDKIVKICGITNKEDALIASRAGANLIGIIFAEGSKRRVDVYMAKEIVDTVRKFGERSDRIILSPPSQYTGTEEWFQQWATLLTGQSKRTPLVVGVFQDQSVEYICEVIEKTGLDLVQLHGNEGWDICGQCSVPAIRVIHVPKDDSGKIADAPFLLKDVKPGLAAAVLLDTCIKNVRGGTGAIFDHSIAAYFGDSGIPVIIAGGLDPDNVEGAVRVSKTWGVDTSSGVEKKGDSRVKDADKVVRFVKALIPQH